MARPKSDIEPRILHAARERFLADGVDGASLRAIARDAGTNIGMVYYYFPTKEQLFLACVEEVYAGILDDLAAILEEGHSLADRLAGVAARLGEMSDDEAIVVRIVIRENLVSKERRAAILDRFAKGHVALIRDEVFRAAGAGEIDPRHSPPVMLLSVAGMLLFPQLLRRVVGERVPFLDALLPPPAELAKGLVDVLLHGLAPRDPQV